MSEDQARDERGRFASGGGGGASGGLAGWAGQRAGKRNWSDEPPRGMAKETWEKHFNGDPRTGGKPTEERARDVHAPIIADALKARPPGPGEQKTVIMTMGGPGSGKSSIMKGVDESRFVTVDPDAVRTKLPEYKQATQGDTVYRNAAAMTHEEASYISKQILSKAIQNGQHVIVDGTGASADSMLAKMKQFKDAGYHVHLSFAHLNDVEEAVKRVESRAEKTGRYVPESFVRSAYKSIPKNFGKISAAADTFAVYDTSRKDAAVIWEKDHGGEKRHDPAAVTAFKAQHGGGS